MATAYKTPGVYIEEIPKFPPSIAPVETAIPAFIGYTEKAAGRGGRRSAPEAEAHLLAWSSTSNSSGVAQKEAVDRRHRDRDHGQRRHDDQKAVAALAEAARSKHIMYYALQMFFANGGGPCYIVSVNPYKATFGDGPGRNRAERGPRCR